MPLVRRAPANRGAGVNDGLPVASARLRSEKAEDRWEAARHLAAWPAAVGSLAAQLENEPDEHVREAILTSLARINTDESFEAVLRHLRADDASLRTAALDALKLMPEMVNLKFDALLHDSDPDIRILACDLARAALPALAVQSLAAILMAEADINVCAAAIDLLAEIGSVEILPELQACGSRFSAPFLNFSIETAAAEINARSARHGG
jgi:HEAT repeat protein